MLIDKTTNFFQLIIHVQVNKKSISMHTELHIVLTHHFHARVHEGIEKYIHVYSSTGSKFYIAGTCIMKHTNMGYEVIWYQA